MASLLLMPSLSPTMEQGVISSWNKQVGELIEVGDMIAEIETDKAVIDFEAAEEGILRELLVATGEEVRVGAPIAILADTAEEDLSDLLAQAKLASTGATAEAPNPPATATPASTPTPPAAPAAMPPAAAAAAPIQSSAAASVTPLAPPTPVTAAGTPGERIKISPYGRKLATQHQIDIARLSGSGPGGRIIARDVEAAVATGAAVAVTPTLAVVASGEAYEDLPISQMRKAVARKMAEAKQTVPHFQATRKVRMDRLVAMREQLKADFPAVKVSINDLIVKACATALGFHPTVNSQYLGDRIRRFHTVDLSVAVATEEGLFTPVLRGANHKNIRQIATEIRELAGRAREKRLAPEEYTGGTFTVSNLGMYGIDEFNGIINTPQSAILAVSAVVREPVVEGDAIVPGHTMNLTLSSDHRLVDGATAAEFLRTLTQILENPIALVL